MRRIIVDTNFLLIPFQFKVDIFTEFQRICDFQYKLYIIDKTIDELNAIATDTKKASDRLFAKLALVLIKAKDINIIATAKDKYVDSLIVEHADNEDIVATQDKVLKSRLKTKNIQTIILRQKRYLKFE